MDIPTARAKLGSHCYYGFRLIIHKNRRLLRLAQIIRALVLLGPLRPALLRYHLSHTATAPLITDITPLFDRLDSDHVLRDLARDGYAHLGLITKSCIPEILEYCQKHNRARYWNPHHECEAIAQIAHNEKIIDIVRRYFGAEPILWLTQIKWSSPNRPNGDRLRPSLHAEPKQYDDHFFHYDTNDLKSVTVFVYLTDVDKDSSPHVVIQGTHKRKSPKALARMLLDDDIAGNIYGGGIKTIVGPTGTAFIEDTLAYHKVSAGKKNRCMLSIDYVLRRRIPPERPILELQMD